MLEGGGQILRNAAALSAITANPMEVSNIRAGRKKPGLRAQHLAGLQLVAELCSGTLEGGDMGSQTIKLTPHHITSGHHTADTKTAGSCMLLAQATTWSPHCLLITTMLPELLVEHRIGIACSRPMQAQVPSGFVRLMVTPCTPQNKTCCALSLQTCLRLHCMPCSAPTPRLQCK